MSNYCVYSSSPDSCTKRFCGTMEECEQWITANKHRFPGYVTLRIQPDDESARWERDFDINSGNSIYEQMNDIDDDDSLEEDVLQEVSKRTLQDFSRSIKHKLTDEYEAVVNTSTACVDICEKESGNVVAQVYPKHKTIEKDYKTLVKIKSIDEIQPDDEIYVKRLKTGNKSVIDGVGLVKRVSGTYDSIEDAFK